MKRLEQIRKDFQNAVEILQEAISEARSDLEIDGVIQRFEFTFELMGKLIKVYLEGEGIICRSPKNCLKEAYQQGIIGDEYLWLRMLNDRNMSVHIYDKETSREIFERIKGSYIRELKGILDKVDKGEEKICCRRDRMRAER